MDFDGDIAKANQQLKVLAMGVVIERRGTKLSLRATLPPRPGSGKDRPHQQRIPIGVTASPAGLRRALAEAKKLGGDLALKQFDWADWGVVISEFPNTGEAIAAFEAIERDRLKPSTWAQIYRPILNKLDRSQDLSPDYLRSLIESQPSNSRGRQNWAMVLGRLAKSAGVAIDMDSLRGGYGHRSRQRLVLPTDAEIVATRDRIANPQWQYAYGLMATYGLRNHEIFFIDPGSIAKAPGAIQITEGKTGSRQVWPCYPEWWELWELWRYDLIPQVTGRHHCEYGQRVGQQFRRLNLGRPYNLRHRWAVRTIEFGWPVELAARQMGHSLQVHTSTYHDWITEDTHRKTWERLMGQGDRPKPPGMN